MKATTLRRTSYLLMGLALLGLLVAFSWAHQTARPAEAAGGTPDMAISIDVGGGGDDCDTRPSTGIGTSCSVPVGGMFTVKGFVDSFTGISGAGGYGGIQLRFIHSSGLTLLQRTGTGEFGSPNYWPDCGGPAESKPASGYQGVCHDFVPPDSMYIGKVLEVDYACTTAGMQTVTMDDANTFFFDSAHSVDNSDKDGNEVLTVTCAAAAVGGIAGLSDVSGATPLAAQDSSSSVSIALMVGLAALFAAGLGGGALVVVRRRRS
jgi:hypothetical protein